MYLKIHNSMNNNLVQQLVYSFIDHSTQTCAVSHIQGTEYEILGWFLTVITKHFKLVCNVYVLLLRTMISWAIFLVLVYPVCDTISKTCLLD